MTGRSHPDAILSESSWLSAVTRQRGRQRRELQSNFSMAFILTMMTSKVSTRVLGICWLTFAITWTRRKSCTASIFLPWDRSRFLVAMRISARFHLWPFGCLWAPTIGESPVAIFDPMNLDNNLQEWWRTTISSKQQVIDTYDRWNLQRSMFLPQVSDAYANVSQRKRISRAG